MKKNSIKNTIVGKRMVRKTKKAAALAAAFLYCLSTLAVNVSAAESKWEIEHTLDLSECTPAGTLLLTISAKTSNKTASQEIDSISGVLEYDTSLFTVEQKDILPSEADAAKECSFQESDGSFSVSYQTPVTVKNDSQLLQIRLHTAKDAQIGKTTVCVTSLKWSGSDQKNSQEIEHHVPAYITIQEAQEAAGDVNGDGKIGLEDARIAMQYYNGTQELDEQQQKRADVNGDGKVNLTDVKLLMQYYNGEIDGFAALPASAV